MTAANDPVIIGPTVAEQDHSADRSMSPTSLPPFKDFDANAHWAWFRSSILPYLDDAMGLAYWLTKNRADAEGIVHKAFERAFRGISGFEGECPRAWIMTIVRDTAYTSMNLGQCPERVAAEDPEAIEPEVCNLDIVYSQNIETPGKILLAESEVDVRSAIASLPLEFREALVLRELQACSYCEIAIITGVSISTVASRIATARNRLTLLLGIV